MIDDIIKLLLEKERDMSPDDRARKNKKDLIDTAERGRSAIELEASKAYKDIIEPYIKTTLANNIRNLIYKGLEMTNDEKNVRISRMQSALNIYTVIERAKEEAVKANAILNVERKAKEKREKIDETAFKKQKEREKIIKRKERILKKGGESNALA